MTSPIGVPRAGVDGSDDVAGGGVGSAATAAAAAVAAQGKMRLGRYSIIKTLGEGSFGKVKCKARGGRWRREFEDGS